MSTTSRALDSLTPRRWAFTTGLAVFVLGFGALTTFTVLDLGDASLPGLFTFRSATIGDGILLPVLTYSLVRSASFHLNWSKHERVIIVVVALLAAAGGVALQVYWLAKSQPRLNWTPPAPHTFNLPGWYHAGFLILACGFLAGAATAALLRIRQKAKSSAMTAEASIRSLGILGTLAPGPAFIALLMEDNAQSGEILGATPLVFLAGSAVLLTLILRWAAGPASLRWCIHANLASLIPAVAVSWFFLPGHVFSTIVILPIFSAALAGAFSSSVLQVKLGPQRVAMALWLGMCMAGPVCAVSSEKEVGVLLLASGCAIATVLVVAELVIFRLLLAEVSAFPKEIALTLLAVLPVVAYGLSGRYFAQEQQAVNSYAPIVGGVAAVLFLAISGRALCRQFKQVIEAEKSDVHADQLSSLKWQAYLAISTFYGAALLVCITSLMGTTSTNKWINGLSSSYIAVFLLGLALSVLAVALWGMERVGRFPWFKPFDRLFAALGCLAWAAVIAFQLVDGYGDWKQLVLSVVVALVSGLFVLEGVVANAATLLGLPVDWQAMVVAGSSAVAVSATTAWMTGPALWSTAGVKSVTFGLASLVVGFAACLLLPFLSARTLPGATPPRQYVIAKPLAGVLQDCFLIILLAVSVGWAPNFFLAHLKDTASWWSVVIPFLALLSAAYVYAMKNNVGHVERENRRLSGHAGVSGVPLPIDERRALTALARHVQRQNYIALIALFPLGLFVIFSEISGFDEGGLKQLVKVNIQ